MVSGEKTRKQEFGGWSWGRGLGGYLEPDREEERVSPVKFFFFLFVCFGREREEALESEGASTNPEPNPLLSSTDFSS